MYCKASSMLAMKSSCSMVVMETSMALSEPHHVDGASVA
jgi:hypothetical protein